MIITIKTKIINIYFLHFLCLYKRVWVCRSMWIEGRCLQKQRRARNALSWSHRSYELSIGVARHQIPASEGAVSILCHWPILPSLKVGFFIETWGTYYIHPCRSVWLMPWALTLLHSVFRDELAQNPYPCSQFWTEGIFKKLFTAQYINCLN